MVYGLCGKTFSTKTDLMCPTNICMPLGGVHMNIMCFQWLKSGKVNEHLLNFAKLLLHVKSCENPHWHC